MMKMVYASTLNKNFNLSKAQVIETATMLYAKTPDNPYLIALLLSTGDKELIELLEKNYQVQLENAYENYFALLHIGRAYMFNKKYYIVDKFFT